MSKNKLARVLLFVTLMLVGLSIVFFFSDQSGLLSNQFSRSVARKIAHQWNEMFHLTWNEFQLEELTTALNGPVRKLAHLIEYTFLGFIAFGGMRFIQDNRTKKSGVMTVMYLIILAATVDEINQFASHGRGASIKDVILDTIGGIFGMYLFLIVRDLIVRIKKLIIRKYMLEEERKNGSQCS